VPVLRECSKNKDHRCGQKGDMGNVYIEKMEQADGILLGSPTYVADVSPEIKALMDAPAWCRRQTAACSGARWAQRGGCPPRRRHPRIRRAESSLPDQRDDRAGSSYWNIGVGLAPGDVERDQEGIQTMKTLGQNMAWLLKKVASPRASELAAAD